MSRDEVPTPLDWQTGFQLLAPKLLLFARQFHSALHDAEDTVQEAFVRCWRKGIRPGGSADALYFSAVRSIALDQLRSSRRRKAREQVAADSSWFEPSGNPELPAGIEEAIGQLPEEQRRTLVLRIWGELTFDQIGSVLGIPPNTAASRYRYAIEHLKKTLAAPFQ